MPKLDGLSLIAVTGSLDVEQDQKKWGQRQRCVAEWRKSQMKPGEVIPQFRRLPSDPRHCEEDDGMAPNIEIM